MNEIAKIERGTLDPELAEHRLRQIELLKMRAKGHTLPEICTELGYKNSKVANEALFEAYGDAGILGETAPLARSTDLMRLEMVFRALAPKVEAGDSRATKLWMEAVMLHARLHGTLAPVVPPDNDAAALLASLTGEDASRFRGATLEVERTTRVRVQQRRTVEEELAELQEAIAKGDAVEVESGQAAESSDA